jgi:hypothetical protein
VRRIDTGAVDGNPGAPLAEYNFYGRGLHLDREVLHLKKTCKGEVLMKQTGFILLLAVLCFFPQSMFAVSRDKTSHLFFIERSKNKNLVQYDIRLTENSDPPDSRPISVYWILESGRHEELNVIEKKYAYGIALQEKLEKDRFKVILAAFKGLEIIVEKLNDSFKAVVPIRGRESILQKIYIKSEETHAGLPRVLYVELFGRNKETGLPVRERISSR